MSNIVPNIREDLIIGCQQCLIGSHVFVAHHLSKHVEPFNSQIEFLIRCCFNIFSDTVILVTFLPGLAS